MKDINELLEFAILGRVKEKNQKVECETYKVNIEREKMRMGCYESM